MPVTSILRNLGAVILAALALTVSPRADARSSAGPYLRITSPAAEQVVAGPDVRVCFEISGIATGPGGCNLHFMLDDRPFEVQFDAAHPHVFTDVPPGTHTIRAYAANHLHEAIPGVFDMVTFSVAYANDENRPEPGVPLLTYNLPQGEYLGIDAADITLDFLVHNVELSRNGYRVFYYVDGKRFIANGNGTTFHLKGLKPGMHRIRLELVDDRGRLVHGPFNSPERLILLSPDKDLPRLRPGQRRPLPPVLPSIHGPMTGGRPWVATEPAQEHESKSKESESVGESPAGATGFTARRPSRETRGVTPDSGETRRVTSRKEPLADVPQSVAGKPAEVETATQQATNAPGEPGTRAEKNGPANPGSKPTTATVGLRRYSMTPPTTATLRAVESGSTGTVMQRVEPAPTVSPAPTAPTPTPALTPAPAITPNPAGKADEKTTSAAKAGKSAGKQRARLTNFIAPQPASAAIPQSAGPVSAVGAAGGASPVGAAGGQRAVAAGDPEASYLVDPRAGRLADPAGAAGGLPRVSPSSAAAAARPATAAPGAVSAAGSRER